MATVDLGDLMLRGEEVLLRPLARDDAPALAAAAAESRETYRLSPVPHGLAQTVPYVERALREKANGARLPFVVIWRDRVVGTTSYLDLQVWEWPAACNRPPRAYPDCVEIGSTWLAASAQRTACNTEAKLLLLRHAFEVWQVQSVFLKTDHRNHRSRTAIERIGATFDGIRRAHMPGADCAVRSSAYYSVVADEWPGVRERLVEMMRQRGGDTAGGAALD